MLYKKMVLLSFKNQNKITSQLVISSDLLLFFCYILAAMTSHYKGKETPELVKFDEGNQSLVIKPGALTIIWGEDDRYWKKPVADGPTELLQVSWLEVTGQVSMNKFEKGEYSVKFRVELKPDNFGWSDGPVYLMVKCANEQRSWRKFDLSTLQPNKQFDVPLERPLKFKVTESRGTNDKLYFGMYEIWRGRWKGGLVIHEVVITPVTPAQ
ncbi:hypothetical protein HPP92_012777 [Vanilla planifolia]|uniref:Protein PHLOEM PROTEIN 2-LIKE A9-like n=1 Tax=Vanilla planifolia TaxID=51239 RepID=A0A835UY56_VANPL|nr:hypothetical protein HPP92_012777 [Vanilla planifolia]